MRALYVDFRKTTYNLDTLITDDTYNLYHFFMDFDELFKKYIEPHIPTRINVKPYLRNAKTDTGDENAERLAREQLKIEEDNKLHDRGTALALRVERFQLKWLTLYGLHECSPTKSAAITHKFKLIDQAMLSTNVKLKIDPIGSTPKDPAVGPNITVVSTLSYIAKQINVYENQLKELMVGILSSNLSYPVVVTPVGLIRPTGDALNNIAPDGFTKYEGDYYYVCRFLLRDSDSLPFNPIQKKQWLTYYQEFKQLFLLYTIPGLNCDYSLLIENRNTINVPFSVFEAKTLFSYKT